MHQESATKAIIILFFLKKTVQLRETDRDREEDKNGQWAGGGGGGVVKKPVLKFCQVWKSNSCSPWYVHAYYSNNYIHAAYVTIMQSLIPSNESSQRNHIY